MILDTSFLAAVRCNESARQLSREHEAAGIPQRIPSMTIAELYAGIGGGTDSFETARAYEELIAGLPVVSMDENIARKAGVIAGLHSASDSKPSIGIGDAAIAATGLVYNEPVVTNDVNDFGSVDGLDIVTWNESRS